MSDRIIQQSLLSDSRFDGLGWFAEVAYQRLALIADDDGCVPMDVDILRRVAFPRKKAVTNKAIKDAVSALVEAGLLIRCTNPRDGSDTLVFSDDRMFRRFFFEGETPNTTTNNNTTNSSSSSKYIPDNKYLSSGVSHNSYGEERNYTVQRNTRTKNIPDTERNPYGTNDGVSTNMGGEDEQRVQDVCRYISNALLIVTPGQVEDVRKWVDDFPDDLIKLAVDIACDAGKRNWNYAKGILRRWENDGLTTLAAVKEHMAKQDAKKKRKQALKADDYSEMNYEDDW